MPHFFTVAKKFFIFLCLSALVAGCSLKTPGSVANNYVKAVADNRIEDAIQYFSLTNGNRGKLLELTNLLYLNIQENGGLDSSSTASVKENGYVSHVKVEIKYKNGKTKNIQFPLVNGSDGWIINSFYMLAESDVEDCIQAVARNSIDEAIKHFSLNNVRDADFITVKKRLLMLHSSIQENNGLDYVAITSIDKNEITAYVNVKIIYKNGKTKNIQFPLVNESDVWKISSLQILARFLAESYVQAVANKRFEEAMGYFSLTDVEEKNLTVVKEKLLKHINILYSNIHKNDGFDSVTSSSYFDDTPSIGVVVKFMNGKEEQSQLNLINENGEWKIKPLSVLTEKVIEDYMQAVSEDRINDAANYFALDDAIEKLKSGRSMGNMQAGIVNISGRLAEILSDNDREVSAEQIIIFPLNERRHTQDTFSNIIEEVNRYTIFRALVKSSIEGLASFIKENGGLDSVSATLVKNDTSSAYVETYMKFKNGKTETVQLHLIWGNSGKFSSDYQWRIKVWSY